MLNKFLDIFRGKIMKKTERIIWLSLVTFLLFLSLFAVFIRPAKGATLSGKFNLDKLEYVIRLIERKYVEEKIDEEKLVNGAVKGLVESLGDPHTMYLSESAMEEMNTTSEGEYGGVGMLISEKDEKIVVMSLFEGTPSFKKGIKSGDFILSVNGESLKGLTVTEAASKLKGEPGTVIKVGIERHGQIFEVELKRAVINLPTVKYAMIDNKYGYLRITQFAGNTDKDVKEALKSFKRKRAEAVIVDLRYNPGGLLSQVIDIVDYFQDDGVIVSTRGREESQYAEAVASKAKTVIDNNVPIIVLIDNGSASASEIFAGAIKDTHRGILIGEKSYGKGSVQTIYSLGKDGVKITIAKYYTPSGISIDKIGIEPSIEVKEPELTDEEKSALKKIYDDKAIDKLIEKNSDPTDSEIEKDIDQLIKDGYKLSRRYLKRLIKNAAEYDDDKKSVYDLDYDIQLQKAVEVLNNGQIKKNESGFYLDENINSAIKH